MTRVLALDLAKLSGWAVGTPDGVESFGTHELPKTGPGANGEYGMAARMFFRRMLDQVKPDLVVFEQPILRSGKIKHHGKGRAFVATIDTPQKLRKIYGLSFELGVECFRAGIEIDEANIGAVRAHFLMGKVPRTTEECKIAVKVMARRRGWAVNDDNEADALAVLDWKLAKIAPKNWTALKINAGASALMSSCGPDVFAQSGGYSARLIRTARPDASKNSSDGRAGASSTAQKSPGKITVTIRRSGAGTSSTLSGSQVTLRLREPGESALRSSRR